MNNPPSGLLAGGAVQATRVAPHIRDSVLIGVDLGPNLSVTGSLATVLWLIALRREGEQIGAGQFLKIGLLVMPPAPLAATVAVAFSWRPGRFKTKLRSQTGTGDDSSRKRRHTADRPHYCAPRAH
jgi:hypothetical protein